MIRAVERVREHLQLAIESLEAAKIQYVVAGDMAVSEWISRIDPSAIRNSKNVEIIVDRKQFDQAHRILSSVGLNRNEVRLFMAGENKAPDTSESEQGDGFR